MSAYKPAQIFAAVNTQPVQPNLQTHSTPEIKKPTHLDGNEIQVTATGELSLVPDKCKVTISVSSKKENPQDAKNSVSRRFDYIIQTLHNHQVKVHAES